MGNHMSWSGNMVVVPKGNTSVKRYELKRADGSTINTSTKKRSLKEMILK